MKYNNANTVNDIFKDIYEYTIDNYKNVDDFRSDLMKHGNIHGCISEILMDMDTQLIFHWETTELFDEFEDECNDWLRELGFKPWEIFPDWDFAVNSKHNKNIVIWAMFEEYVANMEMEQDCTEFRYAQKQKGTNKLQEEKKKRKGYATQAQQREADKRYYHASEENRQRKQYLNTRSTARNFIEKRAKFEDLKDLQERIEKKIKYFKENA